LSRLTSPQILLPSIVVPLIVLVCCVVGCVRHHRRYKTHRRHHSACSPTLNATTGKHTDSRASIYLLSATFHSATFQLVRIVLTKAQLSLGEADCTAGTRRPANVNVVSYVHKLRHNVNFRQRLQILVMQILGSGPLFWENGCP